MADHGRSWQLSRTALARARKSERRTQRGRITLKDLAKVRAQQSQRPLRRRGIALNRGLVPPLAHAAQQHHRLRSHTPHQPRVAITIMTSSSVQRVAHAIIPNIAREAAKMRIERERASLTERLTSAHIDPEFRPVPRVQKDRRRERQHRAPIRVRIARHRAKSIKERIKHKRVRILLVQRVMDHVHHRERGVKRRERTTHGRKNLRKIPAREKREPIARLEQSSKPPARCGLKAPRIVTLLSLRTLRDHTNNPEFARQYRCSLAGL